MAKNKSEHNVISFTRGGQILRNEASMFSQNLGFIFLTLGFFLLAIPFLHFWWTASDNEFNSFFLNLLHEFYVYLGVSENKAINVITLNDVVPTTLGNRFNIPGYQELIVRINGMARKSFAIGVVLSVLVISAYLYISKYIGNTVTKDKHLRGMSIGSYNDLKKSVITYNKEQASKLGIDPNGGYSINGIPYPIMSETQHTALIGSTGAGKTNYLTYLLEQIKERGDRAVIIDKMSSFPGEYYDPEKDILLNTLDLRNSPWDLFNDITDLTEWNNIASIIIEAPKDSTNSYFTDGARSVFALTGYLYTEKCRADRTTPTISGLYNIMVKSSNDEIYEFLNGTEAAIHVHPNSKNQTNGIRGTLANAMGAFTYLPDIKNGQKGFSINKWVENDNESGICFITSRSDKHATLKPLITTWFNLFITTVQAQNRKQSRKIWFIVDELPSLGKLEILNSALAEARQFGVCFVVGIQAVSQIRDIYGHDGADSIMALTRTKVIFNPGDPITADTCSKFIGHREIEQRSTNFTVGRNEIRDGQSVSSRINQERIMIPEQLTQLPNLAAVLVFPGNFPVVETHFEYKKLDQKNPGYIEDPNWSQRVSDRLAIRPNTNTNQSKYKANSQDSYKPDINLGSTLIEGIRNISDNEKTTLSEKYTQIEEQNLHVSKNSDYENFLPENNYKNQNSKGNEATQKENEEPNDAKLVSLEEKQNFGKLIKGNPEQTLTVPSLKLGKNVKSAKNKDTQTSNNGDPKSQKSQFDKVIKPYLNDEDTSDSQNFLIDMDTEAPVQSVEAYGTKRRNKNSKYQNVSPAMEQSEITLEEEEGMSR